MNNSEKILFKRDTDGFTKDLNSAVDKAFSKKDISSAVSFLWVKLFFYIIVFGGIESVF